MSLHQTEQGVNTASRTSQLWGAPKPPRRHFLRELVLTALLTSSLAWTVAVGAGVGMVWYTSHHHWPMPDTWAVILAVATVLALVTGWLVTLLRALHLVRLAFTAALSQGWHTLVGLIFLARTGRQLPDEPPTQWL